ncbi:25303_t:CDS:2, partial [Gigaspora margarita]
ADNVTFLQTTIEAKYLNIFPTLEKEKQLRSKLKRKIVQIENLIKEVSDVLITQNIFLEQKGKTLSNEEIQALMLVYYENKSKINSLNQKITHLKRRIEELEYQSQENNTNIDENDLFEKSIDDALEFAQLGSTILISTKQYLSLIFTIPYLNCNNNNLTNKVWNITSVRFKIKSTIECKIYSTTFYHTNETQEVQFTKAIVAAGLARGISRNTIQSSLATIGITNHIYKSTYYHYQNTYFSPLIASAKSSAATDLQKCIKYALENNKKVLAVGFDCSWSHIRNANQANYSHKPIIAFHIIQKARVAKNNQTRLTKTLNEVNFDKSSRQMEYAILIEVLNQVSTSLVDLDLHLEVCIDEARDFLAVPSEEDTRKMQVDGLIRHLQDDHSRCWSDVYWIKDDPTIILQDPTLCHSFQSQIDTFKNFLKLFVAYLLAKESYALAVTYYNKGYTYLLSKIQEIYCEKPFELGDMLNISMIESGYSAQQQLNVERIRQHNQMLLDSKVALQNKINKPQDLTQYVKVVAETIFKFNNLRPGQVEAINHYLENNKDTFVILKIGTIEYETKIFEEIALGFIHLLYVTPEKLLLKKSLRELCKHLYKEEKLQFIIDKAHCVLDFCHFREQWENLRVLKQDFSHARIMALTATLSYNDIETLWDDLNIDMGNLEVVRSNDLLCPELCFSVQDRDDTKLAWKDQIISLINNIVSQYYAWSQDPIAPNCNSCDNCIKHAEGGVKQIDVLTNILDLLNVVEILCKNNDKLIIPLDVVERVELLDLVNRKKLILLHTKASAELALADLVCCKLVKQTILLEKKANTTYQTCNIVIEEVME